MTDSADGLRFYVGLHQPSDAHNFDRCMVSIARLRERVGDFAAHEWMLDSGAFRELEDHGYYRQSPEHYAAQIVRWARVGRLVAASSQDFMCEPYIFAQRKKHTGITYTIADHQRATITRYDRILRAVAGAAYVLPVLQGYLPEQYAAHLDQYGDRLAAGAWVAVGSVCKRNGNPREIAAVLRAIKERRPDLRLHGFGCKKTALKSQEVRALLYSADSMAWSYSARKQGRDGNSWREAERWAEQITNPAAPPDLPLFEDWSDHE
jgi:hypothetical protein